MSGIIRIGLPSARRSLGRRPSPNPATQPVRFFTNHESPNMVFPAVQVAVSAQGSHHQKPPARTTAPVAPSLFPCSLLFGIVQLNILPLSQCLLSVHSGNTAFYVLQESRNTVFPCSSGDSKESNPKPDQRVFHESRDTNHETRNFICPVTASLPTISHHFPAFPGPPTPPIKGPPAVRRSRSAARRAPFAAAPGALRACSAAANAK